MFLIQLVYFVLIGWWAGLIAAGLGYLLMLSIIGLPFGVIIFNRLPSILILREAGEECGVCHDRHERDSIPFILRVIWFFLFGWELGLLVVGIGYICTATVIGIPLGIWLLNRVPIVMTLSRHYD